ncbi:MAG TPA: SigB/SigF/SigG family RNA polymerase sigma factor [Solirubrobacteraceae bacterium]|nr:SigB/SigF/SigG family RNA polymerase sigma factor [Solirubrobacteraceae bacterium]
MIRAATAAEPSLQLFRRSLKGDRVARDTLVMRFMPLARRLAMRYARSSVALEDLIQVANVALLKAVDRFDPTRGVTFEAFAIPTILGELRRFFRDTSWAVHVPRADQERSRKIREAIAQLSHVNGRSPSVQQLSEYLELSEEDVLEGLQVLEAYSETSLDAPANDDPEAATIALTLGREDVGYELVEDGIVVERAVAALKPREQRMIELRFVHELSQAEIGERLGLSQMQVSRLLRASLTKLRRLIGEIADS